MDDIETKLEPPEDFPFPFTPYDIQKNFMHSLYTTLEERKLGIFESPTGTGKSMSLICGSLAWLLDREKKTKQDVEQNISKLKENLSKESSSSDWLEAHAATAKDKQKRDLLQTHLNRIQKRETKMEDIREKARKFNLETKGKRFKVVKSDKCDNKENYMKFDDKDECETFSDDEILLEDDDLCEYNNNSDESDTENDEEEYTGIKVYFCSRTHSQLSQLVHEIRKSPYSQMNISVVSLSSRQNYCINKSVLRLKHISLINEACKNIHNKKKGNPVKISSKGEKLKKQKTTSGCPFYQQFTIEQLRLKILTEIKDIEEVAETGRDLCSCPYYSSRSAVPDAQIILVPYNTILHKSTRESCGINLKDSVVIIDEAHNLLDAISNIHSSLVTGYQMMSAYSQLIQYKDKYHDKFSPYNLLYLNQLIYILKNFVRKIGGKCGAHPDEITGKETKSSMETLSDFVLSCEIDTINLYKILEFVKKSKLTHKIQGFSMKYKPTVVIHAKEEKKGISSFLRDFDSKKNHHIIQDVPEVEPEDIIEGNPLLSVIGFLESLTNHYEDGRIVCCQNRTMRDSFIKFMLLNPAVYFTDVVKEARSVVVAGGTMQPISEFTDQLFLMAGASLDRINVFTCGHVIKDENILPIIVNSGPTGKLFDFSYQRRNDPGLAEELGRLLLNVCNIVPSGIVCFFPSYEYENYIYNLFEKSNVIAKLGNKKKVLREPKQSGKVDEVLREYGKSAKQGAILFSVVGGKLSEGLNFNDELGRCVIVIGLPYPNLMSPELKEKMNYLDRTIKPNTGKEYYENLCMKAVNQSIGRSVRHKDDYASVLLLDHRYSRERCQAALPNWIQKSLRVENRFGLVMGCLAKFFNSRKAER